MCRALQPRKGMQHIQAQVPRQHPAPYSPVLPRLARLHIQCTLLPCATPVCLQCSARRTGCRATCMRCGGAVLTWRRGCRRLSVRQHRCR